MALIKKLLLDENGKIKWRTDTDCTVRIAKAHGEIFVQLNTYGSKEREVKGQSSVNV